MMRWMALLALLPSVAFAGAGYEFNLAHVRWHTLETEHFLFHWPESTRDPSHPRYFTTAFTASKLALIAEDAFPKITGQFDLELTEKTHVVIYDQDRGWEGNGFALAESDVTGFAADWGPTFRERGRAEFLADVFVHEFAHIVSLKAYLPWAESSIGIDLGGLSEDEEWLRRVGVNTTPGVNFDVGVAMPVYTHGPFWWAEGGAEYWSDRAGTNVWGPSRDAYLRMTVLEDRVLDPAEWMTRTDKEGFDGERGYNQGYSFSLWLRQRFGGDLVTDMARISAQRFHVDWDVVVESATGIPMEDLYDAWVADLQAEYEAQRAAIEADGLVAGTELHVQQPVWLDPDEDFASWSKREQERALDGDNAWVELPGVSPNGKYTTWFDGSLNIATAEPESMGFLGGAYVSDDAWGDWSEGAARAWWAGTARPSWAPSSDRFVTSGPEDLPGKGIGGLIEGINADGVNWSQLVIGVLDSEDGLSIEPVAVPNTLRATEAAWHPSGERIAFVRYGDGTHNLWTIAPDGSDPVQHTFFADGTQMQGLSWTPDGDALVLGVFREVDQDIWQFETDGNTWTRLTDSDLDETDPIVHADGSVWFTANLHDKYDVFRLDRETGEVTQRTNVLGSAYAAFPTANGSVMYTGFTGHGYRVFGLTEDEQLHSVVDYPGVCGPVVCDDSNAPAVVDMSALTESRRYNPIKGSLPVSITPLLRASDRNLEFGANVLVADALEEHTLDLSATFGKDRSLSVSYFNETFWPSIAVGFSRFAYKGTYTFGTDQDGLPDTDDLLLVDVKFEQLSEDAWVSMGRFLSDTVYVNLTADVGRYSFRDLGDGHRWIPYLVGSGLTASVEVSSYGVGSGGDEWINPRGGRSIAVDAALRWSRIVDPELSGAQIDDGQRFSGYSYVPVHAVWTEYIPVPATERHTLQLDFEAGYINRNVLGWDEFAAGGRHPYNWGSGQVGSNSQFSGYEGWSLSGETMLIGSAAYRFPLVREMNRRNGPFYTDKLYLQVMGTAGNLWSYRVEGDTHTEGGSIVANDPGTVRRETPFADYASKNSIPGRENRVLTDVGIELRARTVIWNDYDWDSFLRLSYGIVPTAGYGDVNSDLVQSSVARDAGSELSSEFEPATLRVYVGLGTGW